MNHTHQVEEEEDIMVSATSSSSPAHTTSGGGTPSGSSPTMAAAAATPEMLQVCHPPLLKYCWSLMDHHYPIQTETEEQPYDLTHLSSPGQCSGGPRRPAGRTNVP